MFTTENFGAAVELLRPCHLSFDTSFRLQRFREEAPVREGDRFVSQSSVCSNASLQNRVEVKSRTEVSYDREESVVAANQKKNAPSESWGSVVRAL